MIDGIIVVLLGLVVTMTAWFRIHQIEKEGLECWWMYQEAADKNDIFLTKIGELEKRTRELQNTIIQQRENHYLTSLELERIYRSNDYLIRCIRHYRTPEEIIGD